MRAPTVPIRSKVGVGDSTVAGTVQSLAGGKSIRDALTFGVASGAAAIMTPGTELCRKEDAERLYVVLKEEDGTFPDAGTINRRVPSAPDALI